MSSQSMPRWERRLRAPLRTFPAWSPHAPDRLVFTSNEDGSEQVYVLDVSTGVTRQASSEPVGVTAGQPTADGSGIVWFSDRSGSEAGHFVVQPFEGGAVRPLLDGVPDGWAGGLALGLRRVVAGISTDEGFAIYVSDDGAPARRIHLHREAVLVAGGESYDNGFNLAGLSADETLVALEHSEHGDLMHQALRVVDARTGATVADLRDPGLNLQAAAWSPLPGDQRLLIGHEREGEIRPAIWDVMTGELVPLHLGLPGLVHGNCWWPDASALLLTNLHDGRDELYRLDPSTMALEPIPHPGGVVTGARVRPDGSVWYRHQAGGTEPRLFTTANREELLAPEERPPASRPYVSWEFRNQHGQRVHGFYVTPEGAGPFPTMMRVHGGPTWLDLDRWSPMVQAFVDAGFAVAMVNYRGSVGYGREWRDMLIGDIGGPEIEDVLAGHADLVARGIADPARSVIAGWSWGGYITLMMLGTHPGRFKAGVAGVPVADYVASYDDMSPILQAYDRALLGGTPNELPDLMRERSPIEFVDRVTEPLLIMAGRSDSRCPIRQVMNYVERLEARGHRLETYFYETGHASFVVDEEVRQLSVVLDFLARTV
jgi:dipeptidyl aminopeptidase/acylaminoacyl peptidase